MCDMNFSLSTLESLMLETTEECELLSGQLRIGISEELNHSQIFADVEKICV